MTCALNSRLSLNDRSLRADFVRDSNCFVTVSTGTESTEIWPMTSLS